MKAKLDLTDLWAEINSYCVECGGSPGANVYGNVKRQWAVAAIEAAVCEIVGAALREAAEQKEPAP
jgi:hypothetical protein